MVIKNTTKTKQTKNWRNLDRHKDARIVIYTDFETHYKHVAFCIAEKFIQFSLSACRHFKVCSHCLRKENKSKRCLAESLCSAQYHDWVQINTLQDGFAQSFLLNALVCNEILWTPLKSYYIREGNRLKWINSSVTRKIYKNHCYYYLYLHDIKFIQCLTTSLFTSILVFINIQIC